MTSHQPIQLQEHRLSRGFRAVGLRGARVPAGHVLNIDHFHMSMPTFPSHPHAGFSAVTYMLEDSAGAIVNRDSLGDRSRIAPGALHWTLAGAGVVHEEIPEQPGVDCHGLQIFVKLPRAHEEGAPAIFHVDAADVPEVARGGARIRILSGEHEGRASAIRLPAPTTMLDVQLATGAYVDLDIPAGHEAFAMILAGQGDIGGTPVRQHAVLGLPAGTVRVTAGAEPLQLAFAHSPPLESAVHWSGPFCMSTTEKLAAAHSRYRAGAMGSLAASF